MIFALFALSALALFFFIRGISQHVPAPEVIEPVQIAGPKPPSIFCETVGCYLHTGHRGCCGECDVCAQFGSHDAPIMSGEYVGTHRGAEEATLAHYSGYRPQHGGAGTRGWL